MRIKFYGKFAESISPEVEIDLVPPCRVSEVRKRVAELFPEVANSLVGKRVKACVADQIVGDDYIVPQGQEVEILAPLSGG